jgi:hypothetical protein
MNIPKLDLPKMTSGQLAALLEKVNLSKKGGKISDAIKKIKEFKFNKKDFELDSKKPKSEVNFLQKWIAKMAEEKELERKRKKPNESLVFQDSKEKKQRSPTKTEYKSTKPTKQKRSYSTTETSKKETSDSGSEQNESTVGSNVLPFLDLIAKQSLAFPGIARDVNVLRQNISKLVKIKGETAATKADKFFKTEDQREAELEATRAKSKAATPAAERGGREAAPKEDSGGIGGLLSMLNPVKLIGGLITGIVGGFASLFSGGSILAILSKIFIPAMLIGGLINGILDGIKVWKESGSIVDTLVAALGGFLKFITFGLFGEKELRQGMDTTLKFMMPLLLGVTELFDKVITWMKNNVGFPGAVIPLSKANALIPPFLQEKGVKLEDFKIPAYYPFKKDTSSTKEEKYESSATKSLKEMGTKLDSGEGVFYDKSAKDRLEDKPKEKEKQEKQKASQQALAETVGKSPTPDPYSPINAEKNQDAAKGFLSSKVGINVDPSSSTGYTDQASGKPVTEEEVRRKVIAVGGEPTKILQMAKGASTSPVPAGADGAAGVAGVAGAAGVAGVAGATGATGSIGAAGADGAAPSPPIPTPAMSAPSGSALSTNSSMVAEGQRMDAAADAGTVVNAPMTNNTSGQKAPSSESVADPYNSSFMKNYLTT